MPVLVMHILLDAGNKYDFARRGARIRKIRQWHVETQAVSDPFRMHHQCCQ